jgi:ankyrin repeat protein
MVSEYRYAGYSQNGSISLNGLHLAAYFGLRSLVESILRDIFPQNQRRDDVEADSKDRYGQTPLSCAAYTGHEAVVKLLMERDDVEAE